MFNNLIWNEKGIAEADRDLIATLKWMEQAVEEVHICGLCQSPGGADVVKAFYYSANTTEAN